METSMPKSCLGSLYLANAEEIQMTCRFKVAEASEKIFELAENTWAVYTTGMINTNQVCQAKNMIQTCQIKIFKDCRQSTMASLKPGNFSKNSTRSSLDTHWTFISPAAMIGITLAVFLMGMVMWRKCANKNITPTLTPSVPPC